MPLGFIAMNEALVSVVVPLFNKEKYISTTLKSVVAQTYEHIEVIVIDDSSTDEGLHIAQGVLASHRNRFLNVRVITRSNTGQAAARNEGIGCASGEYVAFLDADDVWHPDKISKQVKYLEENSSKDIVFCNYFMVFENSSKVKAIRLFPIDKKIKSWLLTTGYGGLLESTGLARKNSLLRLGGFDQNLQMCGGLDLAFRFSDLKTAGSVDDYLCGYRVTAGGWHNNKSDLMKSYDLLMEKSDLYGDSESRARKFLNIHLLVWQIRNGQRGESLWQLFLFVMKNPLLFCRYVLATAGRVFLASFRSYLLREGSTQMRKLLSL